MASKTQTITPLMMNADADVRRLKEMEMMYASCVRVSEVEESDMLVLKNSIGNRIMDADYELASGENQVLGALKSDVSNSIYYFIWNSNKNHRILVHDVSIQKTSVVVKSNKLPFIKGTYIIGHVLNLGGDADILYWTDRISRPCSLNVKRFLNNEYGAIQTGDFYMNKKPPVNAPEIVMGYDADILVNNVFSRSAQFAYRYEYADGEFSVFSPISKIGVARAALSIYAGATDYSTTPNYIDVTVLPGGDLVKRIEVVVRFGIDQPWFVFKNLENPASPTALRFDGAGNYIAADPYFASLLNDGVPLAVNDIKLIENRNVVVGYKDGYNQVDVDVTVKPRYNSGAFYLPSLAYFPTFWNQTLNVFTSADKFWVDFTGIEPKRFRVVSINHVVNNTTIKLFYEASSSVVTISDLLTELVAYANEVYGGFLVFTWSGSGLAVERPGDPFNSVVSGRSVVYTSEQLTSSFLDGDTYDVSVIYYDDYLGNSPISSTAVTQVELKDFYRRYIDFRLSDLSSLGFNNFFHQLSSCHLDVLIKGVPPIYAKSYRIAVKSSSRVSDFRDYGVTRAFYDPTSNRVWLNIQHQIEVDDSFSAGPAEAPDDEFTPLRGDLLEVRFALDGGFGSGKSVSLVTYDLPTVETPRSRVISYKYAEPNAATNPFYVPGDKYTYGNMISIEPIGQWGFDADSIASGDSIWNRSDVRSVIVRIKRPSGEVPVDSFYEISKAIPIVNPGLSTRTHGGLNANQGVSVLYPVTSINATGDLVTFTNYQDNISVGDKFVFNGPSVPAGTFTVKSVIKRGTVSITTEENIPPGAYTVESITTTGEFATTTIKDGNVWTRVKPVARRDSTAASFESHFIIMSESRSHSSYFYSQNFSKGRVHGSSEYARQIMRRSSILLSEPINQAGFNGLSVFNLPLTPFKDLSISSGEIQRIAEVNDNVVLYYDEQVGVVKLNKAILFSASGEAALTLSSDLVSEEIVLSNSNGTRKPTSVSDEMFYDIDRGDICLIAQGVERVSDERVASILAAESSTSQDVIGNEVIRVYAGVEPKSGNRTFTREAYSVWDVEDTNTFITCKAINITEDVNNIYVPAVPRKMDGVGVQSMVQIFKTGVFFLPEIEISDLTTYSFDVIIFPSKDLIIAPADNQFTVTYTASTGLITIPKTSGLVVQKCYDVDSFGITFGGKAGWPSTMPYCPNGGFIHVNNSMYSFFNGKIYLHDLEANRNEFYGKHYNSVVKICFNDMFNATKHFKSIKIDGSHPWAIKASTNISKTEFPKNFFEKIESFFYTDLPFDVSKTSTAHVAPIGEISLVAGNDITVPGFRQDVTPLVAGDSITIGGGPLATVVSVAGNVITVNSGALLSNGMFIFVEKNGLVDGDSIRGYYLVLEMISNEHVDVELNSVTAYFTESKDNLLTQ